jgi:hypothetical protein
MSTPCQIRSYSGGYHQNTIGHRVVVPLNLLLPTGDGFGSPSTSVSNHTKLVHESDTKLNARVIYSNVLDLGVTIKVPLVAWRCGNRIECLAESR